MGCGEGRMRGRCGGERTNTDKNKYKENWVHAFNTGVLIDIQSNMVKDEVSPALDET